MERQKTQCGTVQKVLNMFKMLVSQTILIYLQICNTIVVNYSLNGDSCLEAPAFQVRVVKYVDDVHFLKINLHNVHNVLFVPEF